MPSPRAPITVKALRTICEVAALEQDWNTLHAESAQRNPFQSYDWTLACWTANKRSAELFVVTATAAGRLVGIAPMCIERRSGFRILRFIADDRSDYLGFLARSDEPEIEQAILEQLTRFEHEWDLVLLRQLADTYTSLHAGSLPASLGWHRTRWTRSPYCAWDGDWKSFEREGPPWFREMRKRSRRFYRDGHRTERFTGADAVSRLAIVSEIEAKSWKGRLGTARLQGGPGGELLRRAFETLGSRGEMQLWLAYVGERAAAFQLDFVLRDRLWHYQCAYDEDFGRTRAGSVLAYASLEYAWQQGIREFDYLAGEEPYKLARTTGSRAIHYLAGHRRTAKGWLAYALLLAPRWRLRQVRILRHVYEQLKTAKQTLRKWKSA